MKASGLEPQTGMPRHPLSDQGGHHDGRAVAGRTPAGPSSPEQLAFFACDTRGQAKPPKQNSQQDVLKGTTFEDIFR